jgi:hypothetical protein
MAAIDVPNDSNAAHELRREVTAEELARAARDYEATREKNARIDKTIFTVGAVMVCLGIGWIIRRRSQMAATADNAAVEVAAHGLRAKRRLGRSIQAFLQRVRDRADVNS